jgi:hypothetical protein
VAQYVSHEVFVIIVLGPEHGRPRPARPSSHRHVVGRLGMRWFAIFGILIAAAPVFAQNGFSATYDCARQVTIKGSVTRIEWTNPHAFILVNVQDALGVLTGLGRGNWKSAGSREAHHFAASPDRTDLAAQSTNARLRSDNRRSGSLYQALVAAMDHCTDYGVQVDTGRRNVRVHLPGRRPVRA